MAPFHAFFRGLIKLFALIAGIAIIVMMGITVVDVVLRLFGIGITGAYDLVRACGAIAISCALPYLTAVKGHIAIEFLYHRSRKPVRIVLDAVFRLSSLVMFGILTVKLFQYSLYMLDTGEVFPNLGMPVFWIPMIVSLDFALMMIVILYHLVHPGKAYIEP